MKKILTMALSVLLVSACGGGGSSSSNTGNDTTGGSTTDNSTKVQSYRNDIVGKWYYCMPAYSGLSYFGYLEFKRESGLRDNFEGTARDYRKLTTEANCGGLASAEYTLHTNALYQITNAVTLSGGIDGMRMVTRDIFRGGDSENRASIIGNTRMYFVKKRSDGSLTDELNYDIELRKAR